MINRLLSSYQAQVHILEQGQHTLYHDYTQSLNQINHNSREILNEMTGFHKKRHEGWEEDLKVLRHNYRKALHTSEQRTKVITQTTNSPNNPYMCLYIHI